MLDVSDAVREVVLEPPRGEGVVESQFTAVAVSGTGTLLLADLANGQVWILVPRGTTGLCRVPPHRVPAGGPPWIELHPTQALAEGQARCVGCHSTKTCAHCHVTGEYKEYD